MKPNIIGNKVALIKIALNGIKAIKMLYPDDYHILDDLKINLEIDYKNNREELKLFNLGLKERRQLEKIGNLEGFEEVQTTLPGFFK